MVVFSFIANRLNVGITGLEAGSGAHYIPKWTEIAVTLSIVAVGFATFRLIAQYFPVFEAHSHEIRAGESGRNGGRLQSPCNEPSYGKFGSSLAAKLAICVVASTAAFFASVRLSSICASSADHSERLVEQSAERITDVILRSTRYQMLHNDRDALHNMVREMGSEPGIQRIRIFNKDGRITFSHRHHRTGHSGGQDRRAVLRLPPAGGAAGQAQPARPLPHLHRQTAGSVCWARSGPSTTPRIAPTPPATSTAPISSVLGVIDANLSLATVDAQIAQQQAGLVWFLVVAVVLGSGLAVTFIWFVVYRPVKELIDGTHRVAGGDLDYRLPVRSEDELGDLARSFNKMTAEVAGVQAEIEERVRRKTAELERVHKTLLSSEKMASIGKLAATVAHEINNPLFGILTYARLVKRGLGKLEFAERDEMAEQLQTIERESKRCGDLVKNLLTFSRQAPSNREPNDLNAVVHRAVLLVKHKLDMQGIELVETVGAQTCRRWNATPTRSSRSSWS